MKAKSKAVYRDDYYDQESDATAITKDNMLSLISKRLNWYDDIASIFENAIHGTRVIILSDKEATRHNKRALASDWVAVGKDIKMAIKKYESDEPIGKTRPKYKGKPN